MVAGPAITSYASILAGRPVTVRCDRVQSFAPGELGYTLYDAATKVVDPTIYLPSTMCNRLGRLADRSRLVVVDTRTTHTAARGASAQVDVADGSAVDTLIHEATHIREQSTDESRVECDSYRNRWSAVKLFGLSARMAGRVMRGITVAHEASPASYLRDC